MQTTRNERTHACVLSLRFVMGAGFDKSKDPLVGFVVGNAIVYDLANTKMSHNAAGHITCCRSTPWCKYQSVHVEKCSGPHAWPHLSPLKLVTRYVFSLGGPLWPIDCIDCIRLRDTSSVARVQGNACRDCRLCFGWRGRPPGRFVRGFLHGCWIGLASGFEGFTPR